MKKKKCVARRKKVLGDIGKKKAGRFKFVGGVLG